MSFERRITTLLIGLVLTTISFGQTAKPVEYLGVTGPISFNKVNYNLAWTSHPADNYYKQEYLAKGDVIERFKKLVLLEILTGNTALKDIVAAKIVELKQMKQSNPLVQYEAFEKDGEVILDFLVSQNAPDGNSVSIVERNVYRYKSLAEKSGKKGVLLFGVSERSYGNDVDLFLANLKAHRLDLITLVGAFNIPSITIAK